jgi:NAD(P)-dependent dehydrogenase (short-subunit alcohol dehydrogenase family)
MNDTVRLRISALSTIGNSVSEAAVTGSQHPARTVIVTGAASGMGEACLGRFLSEGWTSIGIDIAPIRLVSEGAIELRADIREAAQLSTGLATIQPPLRQVQALVNAAGIFPTSNLDSLNTDLYRRIFDTNVLGTLLTTQAVLSYLVDAAAIVNFASIDAFVPPDNQLLYMASKAAVVGATKAMARELAPRGMRVNAIAPGWVRTPPNIASGRMEAALSAVPLNRAAEPEEMAELVFWLVTGAGAQYISGETIVASGGLVMR